MEAHGRMEVDNSKSPTDFLRLFTSRFPPDQFLLIRYIGRKEDGKGAIPKVSSPTPDGLRRADLDIDKFNRKPEEGLKPRNVYFSPFPRTARYGGEETVTEMGVVYVDMDVGEGYYEGTNRLKFPSKEVALKFLQKKVRKAIVPPYHMLVDSGRGLHVYWFLRDPLPAEQQDLWKRIMVALTLALNGDMSRAKSLDSLMRVAGSLNLNGPEPVPCKVLEYYEGGYPIEVFPLASEEEVAQHAGSSRRKKGGRRALKSGELPDDASLEHHLLVEALRSLGFGVAPRLDSKGSFVGTRLHTCPYCGDQPSSTGEPSTWTAWVHPKTLHLGCWRPECPAHDPAVDLEDWLPILLDPVPEVLKGLFPHSLGQAEIALGEVINIAMNHAEAGAIPIVQTPPGLGKTRQTVHRLVLDADKGHGATLLVPTHALADEAAGRIEAYAKEQGLDVHVLHATSMSRSCLHRQQLQKWGRYVSWARTVCLRCEGRDQCPVHTQFDGIDRSRTVIVAVHAHLPHLISRRVLGKYVVIDEACSFEKRQEWRTRVIEAVLARRTEWFAARYAVAGFCLKVLEKAVEYHARLTERQRSAIFAISARRGIAEDALRTRVVEAYGVPLDELSRREASELITRLNANGNGDNGGSDGNGKAAGGMA